MSGGGSSVPRWRSTVLASWATGLRNGGHCEHQKVTVVIACMIRARGGRSRVSHNELGSVAAPTAYPHGARENFTDVTARHTL